MGKRFLLMLGLTLFLSSCTTYKIYDATTYVDPTVDDEVIVNDNLTKFLKKNSKPKIVLRVPTTASVTETEQTNLDLMYNIIEKEFLKAGFTVRDRALLNQLLKDGEADYSKIAKKIDTDLILDIQNLNLWYKDIEATSFKVPSMNWEGRFKDIHCGYDIPLQAVFTISVFEANIILISNGELGGYVKFNYSPWQKKDVEFFYFSGENNHILRPQGGPQRSKNSFDKLGWDKTKVNYCKLPYKIGNDNDWAETKEEAIKYFSKKLISNISSEN